MSPKITRLSRLMLHVLVAWSALLVWPADHANGAFITTAVGNTNMDFFPDFPGFGGVDGTVNFAVLDRAGTTSGDSWGTGFSGFDSHFVPDIGSVDLQTGDRFLYLFQVANNGSDTNAIDTLAVSLIGPNTLINSYGHFSMLGFADDAGAVSAGNDFGTSGTFAFPAVANIGVDSPGIVDLSGSSDTVAPSRVRLLSESVKATWDDELADGVRSTIVGFTSDAGPGFALSTLRDGGFPAAGDLTAPVPEPSAWMLGCLAAPFGLAMARRRRRSQSQ